MHGGELCSTAVMAAERPDGTVSKALVQAAMIPAVLALLVAAVLAIEVKSLVSLSRWVQHTDEVISTAREIHGLLADRESGLRGYLLGRSPEFLAPYEAANAALRSRWERLSAL